MNPACTEVGVSVGRLVLLLHIDRHKPDRLLHQGDNALHVSLFSLLSHY